MHRRSIWKSRRRATDVLVITACTALALAITGASARAESTARVDTNGPYSIALTALTGPDASDLVLAIDAGTAETPATLKKVQLKTFAADDTVAEVRNLKDVALDHGAVHFDLGNVARGRRVEADVLIQTPADPQAYVVRGTTTTRFRPDLTAAIFAPLQTTTARPIDVVAEIAETKGDTAATTATVTLMLGPTPLAEPAVVSVPAGGRTSVTFNGVKLPNAVPTEISVFVKDASPAEFDTTNNAATRTVDVTENELVTARLVLPSFGGYGAQFNNHLYAPITPKPPNGYADLEAKVKALEPHLVRIFYNDNWEENKDGTHPSPEFELNYASFVKTVQLAQESGATIEISYQNLATARLAPEPAMTKYANVLEELIRKYGLTNVRWVEIGNEPNNGLLTLAQYNVLYRILNAQLIARGLRDQIHLMGAGLLELAGAKHHYVWQEWIAENMGDILDAYSEHIYWWYDKPGRLEFRLRDIHRLMTEILPEGQRKPMYLMEFGIRGYQTCGSKPTLQANRYYLPECLEIWKTNIAAFQQFWFNIHAAQLGFPGTAKWDAYQAVYDRTSVNAQVHWLIGPGSEGFPLMPAYHALSLLFHTTERGWQIIGVDPWDSSDWDAPDTPTGDTANDTPEKEITAFTDGGQLTLLGLDTRGASLNTASTEAAAYSIGGLPASKTFNLALWNGTGDGTNSIARTVTTNEAGVARFEVPLQAAFALTTVPVT